MSLDRDNNRIPATGLLLAGGNSKRMGYDKRFISIGDETLFDRALRVLKENFKNVYVSISRKDDQLFDEIEEICILDHPFAKGPMAGIMAGLKASTYDSVFVLAVDMPFVDSALIRYIMGFSDSSHAVIPFVNNRIEPLCGVYKKELLDRITIWARNRNFSLNDFLRACTDLKIRFLKEDELEISGFSNKVFKSINRPEDLAAIK